MFCVDVCVDAYKREYKHINISSEGFIHFCWKYLPPWDCSKKKKKNGTAVKKSNVTWSSRASSVSSKYPAVWNGSRCLRPVSHLRNALPSAWTKHKPGSGSFRSNVCESECWCRSAAAAQVQICTDMTEEILNQHQSRDPFWLGETRSSSASCRGGCEHCCDSCYSMFFSKRRSDLFVFTVSHSSGLLTPLACWRHTTPSWRDKAAWGFIPQHYQNLHEFSIKAALQ